jgi:hypothetical protein
MPPSCAGIGDVVERFLQGVSEGDLNEIDRRVQMAIEPQYGTVFQACLNSMTGSEDVLAAVHEETRAHLDASLGSANLAEMFNERYKTPQAGERVIDQTFREAAPSWVCSPSPAGEVVVIGCPAGSIGEPLRELARRTIAIPGLPFANMPDDLTIYREWPAIPVGSLPHTSGVGIKAYRAAAESLQCSPHARLDISNWSEMDEG